MAIERGSFEVTRARVDDAIHNGADSPMPSELVALSKKGNHLPLQIYAILYEVLARNGNEFRVTPEQITESLHDVFPPEHHRFGGEKPVTIEGVNAGLMDLYGYRFADRRKTVGNGWEWKISADNPTLKLPLPPTATQ
jgi:hypothetical protein